MAIYAITDTQLTNIADKIRSKLGTSDLIGVDDMPAEIEKITGGEGAYTSNAHNSVTDIPGTYIDGSGRQVAYSGWSSSDYIYIPDGATHVYSIGASSDYNACYDKDKNFVSGIKSGRVSIPTNAKYLRFSNYTNGFNTMLVFYVNDYHD